MKGLLTFRVDVRQTTSEVACSIVIHETIVYTNNAHIC